MKELQVPRKKKRHKGWSKGKVFGVLFCIVAILLVAYGAWQYSQSLPSSDENEDLPPLYTLTDGNLSEFRGRIVVLDLFATWCQPCIQEIPHLAQINEKYDSNHVVVISIASSGDDVTALRQFKKEYDMTWKVAADTVGVFDKYNVMYIPTLVILDSNGAVYYRNEGLTDEATLSEKIDFLLG